MKAAAIDRFGGPDELRLRTLSIPQIEPDEVLVHVDTAGVGVWDPWVREGELAQMSGEKPHFPFVLGAEGAGTIAELGANVKRFHPGDRVYGFQSLGARDGFYAEYIVLKSADVAPVPEGLSLEAAGAMPADAVTALCGLELLKLQPGESLAIFGASGGIGHLALQLAKRMGARVLAIASGTDGVELCRRLGANAVVDGRGGDVSSAIRAFAPKGIDVALLTAGGDRVGVLLDARRQGARAAYPNGVEPEPTSRPGVLMLAYDGRVSSGLFERLNRLIEMGSFTVCVASTYPLERAGEAHRALGQHHLGKLALKVGTA
jgi:NADPH:quinone reductase